MNLHRRQRKPLHHCWHPSVCVTSFSWPSSPASCQNLGPFSGQFHGAVICNLCPLTLFCYIIVLVLNYLRTWWCTIAVFFSEQVVASIHSNDGCKGEIDPFLVYGPSSLTDGGDLWHFRRVWDFLVVWDLLSHVNSNRRKGGAADRYSTNYLRGCR